MATKEELARDLGRVAREPGARDVMRAFSGLHAAALADGELSAAVKELIAIAISVATGCEACITWHVAGAVEAGATRAQVAEALGVAVLMGGGPATQYAAKAVAALDAHGVPAST